CPHRQSNGYQTCNQEFRFHYRLISGHAHTERCPSKSLDYPPITRYRRIKGYGGRPGRGWLVALGREKCHRCKASDATETIPAPDPRHFVAVRRTSGRAISGFAGTRRNGFQSVEFRQNQVAERAMAKPGLVSRRTSG